MADDKSLAKIRAWQQAAAAKREQNARLAGVGRGTVDFSGNVHEEAASHSKTHKRRSKQHKDSISDVRDSTEPPEPPPSKERRSKSMMATRISNPDKGIDIYYHKPVVVRFKSKDDVIK